MRARAFLFFSSVLAMLPVGLAVAQTPATTTVRWQLDAPNSDWVVRNGVEIVSLNHDGLIVRATLIAHEPRDVALVSVTNQTDQRIELLPSRITLDLVEPELKPFPYIDPDTLAEKARQVSPWIYALGAMAIAWTASDRAAQDRVWNEVETAEEREQERKAAEGSNIQREGLRENTLLPGESVAGAVYFAAPKHYAKDYGTGKLETVLRVLVGDYVFEFPCYWDGWATVKHVRPLLSRNGYYVFDFPTWWKARRATTILSEQSGQPQALAGAAPATVESTTVTVNSAPDGADVTVDGKFVGNTPSTLRLAPGDHSVSVEKSGFKPWQRKVTLTAGSSPTISATLEKDLVSSPAANNTKPSDELRAAESSPSAVSDLSGSYAGEVANSTLGISAPFAIDVREENGGIHGCTTVQKPLVGSGGFQGTVNGSKVIFEATGKKLRIRFIGELQGDALKGSYTVLSTQEHGNFQLRRVDSKAPDVGFNPAECRKD